MMNKKFAVFKATSIALDKALKSPTSINTVASFGLYLFSEWAKLAKPLIKEAGSKSTTSDKWVESFIKEIDSKMGEYQDNIAKTQAEYIDYLYKYYKNEFIKTNKIEIVQKAKLPEVSPVLWLDKDDDALAGIKKMMSRSTGQFYKGNVQRTVAESVRKNILESNEPLDVAVPKMQADLAKALKIEAGSLASEVVPVGYRGTAESYFSGLADHTASMARTSGALTTLAEIDAKQFVIRSIKSSRTCLGCLAMDGQTYSVELGTKHMSEILAANNVEDLKDIQPFFHFKAPSDYTKEGLKEAKVSADELAKQSGVQIPPFHFRCECFVDMA